MRKNSTPTDTVVELLAVGMRGVCQSFEGNGQWCGGCTFNKSAHGALPTPPQLERARRLAEFLYSQGCTLAVSRGNHHDRSREAGMKLLLRITAVFGTWFVGFRAGTRAADQTPLSRRLSSLNALQPGINFNLLND